MKKDITVGEIVAHDYRTAFVFKEAEIDFCCGGKKSIDQTRSEKGTFCSATTGGDKTQ